MPDTIELEQIESERIEGKGVITFPGRNGLEHRVFDKTDPVQLTAAQALFNELKTDKKFLAYSGPEGNQSVISDFDPDAEAIVMTQQVQGG